MTSVTGKADCRGFTLAELCIAGAIIGMISTISWPAIREYAQTIVLKTNSRSLVQRLRDAREMAAMTGQTQRVTVIKDPFVRSSGSEAVFHPDGTADHFQISFESKNGRKILIEVEETGRVNYRG